MWECLEEVYLQGTKDKEFQLKQQLQSVKFGIKIIDNYIKEFKGTCDGLAAIHKPVNEDRKVINFARGISPKYKTFRTVMLGKTLYPTLNQFDNALRGFDMREDEEAHDNFDSVKVQTVSPYINSDNVVIPHVLIDDESIIDLSGVGPGSDAKEQVEVTEEHVALTGPTNDHHQTTTLVDVPVDHQPDNATLHSTTSVDVPVDVLLAPKGDHIITRHKVNEQHLSLVARNNIEIVRELTAKKARKSPHWLAAMQEEIDALHTNKTWIFVPKSPCINLVVSKWMFKTKLKVDGTIDRYKARLVARGFSHLEGIDFEETFSPVVKATTIRVVLSISFNSKGKLDN
nr:uncharacterized protein LOC109121087 [Solanum lycopersicum]